MGKFQDLTGQKFGKLIVLCDSGERDASGNVIWECECSCGTHIKCSGRNLKLGNIKNCKKCNFKDITGKVFGNLIALEYFGRGSNDKVVWKCKCLLCNKEVYIESKSLCRSSKNRDCGCSKNLLGKVYGNFTVIEKLEAKNEKQYWKCVCGVCGTESVTDSTRIINLQKGCATCGKPIEDLTGKTFGSLRVISIFNKKCRYGYRFWECECLHCGKHTIVSTTALKSGHTKSCGCRNFKDLTGMCFGYLEVKELSPDRKYGRISWICKCKMCGDTVIYTSGELLYRNKISCGCVNSKAEYTTKSILSENNIEFIHQKTFDGCVNKRSLFFDFYIPSLNLCIELDGQQHSIPIDFFGGDSTLKDTQIRDDIKNKYCKKNKINLLRIPYFQFDNIERILIENNIIKGELNART